MIEILLEEKKSLKEKISKAMLELKKWFNDKIISIKDFFSNLRSKFNKNKGSAKTDDSPIYKDVKVNNEVLFKKGTPINKIWIKIDDSLDLIKQESEKAIEGCKTGISNIVKFNNDKAVINQHQVIENVKKISIMSSIVISGIGIIIFTRKQKALDNSKKDQKALDNSKKDQKALDNSKKDQQYLNEPINKLPIKKSRSKKVDDVIKTNTKPKKPRKSVLKSNPLSDLLDDNDNDTMISKVKGIKQSVKRAERQYKKIEAEYETRASEIRNNNSEEQIPSKLNILKISIDNRLRNYTDKINMYNSEIERLENIISNGPKTEETMLDNLEVYLEYKSSFRSTLNKVMNDLKEWFYKKMETIKDFLYHLKNKFIGVKEKLLGVDSYGISINIKHGDKILYKKGTATTTLWSDIGNIMQETKFEVDNTIKECKDGIRSITRNEKEIAVDIKYSVTDRFKRIAFLTSITVSCLSAILLTQSTKINNSREKQYQDVIKRDRSKFKASNKDRDSREEELKNEISNLNKLISNVKIDTDEEDSFKNSIFE